MKVGSVGWEGLVVGFGGFSIGVVFYIFFWFWLLWIDIYGFFWDY